MKNETIAGLDLGSTKVVCAIAKLKEDAAPELIGVGISKSRGFKNGIVTSLKEATESIGAAVHEAAKVANVKLFELYVGISGNHLQGENSRGMISISRQGKEITEEDVRQVIEQAASVKIPADRKIIRTIPQEFVVDGQTGIKDPVGLEGSRIEGDIYLITGAASIVQNISKAVARAGFKVREMIPQSIASSYAVLASDDKEFGCMVIDIGDGTTDGVVFQGNNIRDTFTVTLGGADVTSDISIGLAVPRLHAEDIKLEYGVARSELAGQGEMKIRRPGQEGEETVERKMLASIIAPRMEEIFGLVNRKLRYMDLDSLPSGLVLTGGTAKMTGINGLAERIFGVPAKMGSPNTVEGLSEEMRDPAYATSIGLLIYGMNHRNNERMAQDLRKPVFSKFGKKIEDWLMK
jgi:cell division protein FtsA